MSTPTSELRSDAPWYDGLTPMHWRVLKGSFLGWVFDGYEALALVVVLVPALHSLLSPEQTASFAVYAGTVLGISVSAFGRMPLRPKAKSESSGSNRLPNAANRRMRFNVSGSATFESADLRSTRSFSSHLRKSLAD